MKHYIKLLILSLLCAVTLSAQEFFVPPFTIEPTFYDRSAGQVIDFWHAPMKVADAHTINKGDKAVIFVNDTAGKFEHSDLPNDGNIYAINTTPEANADGHGHGHMCAGIIAAQDNAIGVKGIAPDVLLVPVKGLRNSGAGYSTELAASIRACADADLGEYNDRIRIISNSWGGPSPVKVIQDAIDYAISKGCIVAASAGNSGCSSPGVNTIGYPARYLNVISIASINADNTPSSFSSCGEGLDVTAYGYRIYTCNNQNNYSTVAGTSFSNPMLAGLLALDVTANYDAYKKAEAGRNALALTRLRKFAQDMHTPGWDENTGFGRPTGDMIFNPVDTKPEDPEPPKPEPPTTSYPKREMLIALPGNYVMQWKPNNGGKYERLKIQLDVRYTDTVHSAAAVEKIRQQTEAFWRNRFFVLLKDDDPWNALRWGRHFYEMMLNNAGFNVEVSLMIGDDVLYLTDDTPRYNKFLKKRAINNVRIFEVNQ